MTRKEFIKMCGILGVSLPLEAALAACGKADARQPNFSGKVIVIGAGAGGLSAAYLLQQQGIDVEILEASPVFGGRMKINRDFADFPIPLGAEWLETNASVFQEIVNDPTVQVNIQTIPDAPDRKFVNYSWFQFFEDYIVPPLSARIRYSTVVQSIDYAAERTVITTAGGVYVADKVVLAVPLKILQEGDILFTPALPASKRETVAEMTVWDGFKAFFEFSEKFYDAEWAFTITPESAGQKIFYDAAFGQNTDRNILGLFAVGTPARDYLSLSDAQFKATILGELDARYANRATPNYVKHIAQNWNNEPFIRGGYLSDYADWRKVRELGQPVAEKIYFAGGAFTDGEDWVSVHTAAQSAKSAVEQLLVG
ncbi:FAD-dependent oxidoreductase [Neolewinella lacunae]|uniref:Tryptophan 2-monooxygenase n=1 Tax=Neolewinella lacunae TaxID=1517758 RepID=A0A923PGF6_9BACT|nr:FAD-dependent oxidoreductase [Neolewinella lacunae]MBC6993668.1 FAD-dependent oxidoreductase [Neolewinella lacunae]MDN3636363.1 FAD-dependent oxidoreductase [Neolewinella lacunae]